MSALPGPRAAILLGAVLFSTGGAAIKFSSFGGWQIACLRALIAGLTVLALLPAARRGWSWGVLPVAACYSGALLLFVLSTKLTTAANAIFIQSTAPIWILAMGPWILKEPIRRSDLAFMAVLAAGMALFFLPSGAAPPPTAPDPFLGNALAVGSSVCMAGLFTGLRWFARREGGDGDRPAAVIVLGSLLLFAASLPMTFPWTAGRASDWVVLVYLGIFQIGLAYLLVARALRTVSALEASLLLLLEPVLNPVWTWLVHREDPGVFALLGGTVILAATAFRALRRNPLESPRPAG